MPQEAKIWGIGNLKTTYERVFNHEKGDYEKIPQKRCTGTVDFPVLADLAGKYEDKTIYIYTEEEHRAKQVENPLEGMSVIAEFLKTIGLTLKDLETEWNKFMESQKGE